MIPVGLAGLDYPRKVQCQAGQSVRLVPQKERQALQAVLVRLVWDREARTCQEIQAGQAGRLVQVAQEVMNRALQALQALQVIRSDLLHPSDREAQPCHQVKVASQQRRPPGCGNA
jgi:hypothetical protein